MKRVLFLAMIAAATLGGCKKSSPTAPTTPGETAMAEPAAPTEPGAPAPKEAIAELARASNSNVKGTISFKEVADGVEVTANVEGLTPGEHAYHVHEKGDCAAPDATSAGGHFNPSGHQHGAPNAPEHHEGDFGNLTAGNDGKATKTFVMKGITVAEGPTSVVGRGFIVHEKADDFKTQPTGNAGGRVACGVITLK
jgi:Cu-Zn family superoxide dismutase